MLPNPPEFPVERAKSRPRNGSGIRAMYETFYDQMYNQTTKNISVTVTPIFLEDQSEPDEDHFVWAYQVRIENHGPETVQLRSRYWHITDANGLVQEVRGSGVVGEQPVLEPGESFEYTSGTPLNTPSGIMVGSYQMQTDEGDLIEVDIPAFSLDSPHQVVRPN